MSAPIPSTLRLHPGLLRLRDLRRVVAAPVSLSIDEGDLLGVDASANAVTKIVAQGLPAYGINTGFGLLAQTRIPTDELRDLQHNLLRSHAAGIGNLLPDEVVRLILVLKIASLARGYSGVRRELIASLNALLTHEVYPCIPGKGSVGASGDLAPLAHLCLPLIGEGTVRHRGQVLSAMEGLRIARLQPLTLAPKEGLALINGTQVSTALALTGLFYAENVFASALIAGMLSVDALKGSDAPFDKRVHEVRRHRGQREVAAACRKLLAGSEIRASHVACARVQDPYSLRCQPQVMGGCLDVLRYAARTLTIEANSVTDNPLVFAEGGVVISGGNFHAEPVALVADHLALALTEIANLSERRVALLVDPKMSGLPAFLVNDSGANSGFMIAQVTAAALASENKSRAHPASVDSIPTSANQEDHVSMATFAALRLADMAANSAGVVGIELLAAAQGIDLHRPMRSSAALEAVHADIRSKVARYDRDRFMAPDIETAAGWVLSGRFNGVVKGILPSR